MWHYPEVVYMDRDLLPQTISKQSPPDLGKTAARTLGGQFKKEHYRSIYFHHSSPEADEKYDTYIDGLGNEVKVAQKKKKASKAELKKIKKLVTEKRKAGMEVFTDDELEEAGFLVGE